MIPKFFAKGTLARQTCIAALLGFLPFASAKAKPLTVNITSSVAQGSSVGVAQNIPITVTFSNPVTGFQASLLSVQNATATFLSQSGNAYKLTLVSQGAGAIQVFMPAGQIQDANGNLNSASNTLNWNAIQPPSVSLNATVPANTVSANTSVVVTATFSSVVTNFDLSHVTVLNGVIPVSTFVANSAQSFSFTVEPNNSGIVTVISNAGTAVDSYGNASLPSTPYSWTFTASPVAADPPPTVFLTANNTATALSGNLVTVTVTSLQSTTNNLTSNSIVTRNATIQNFQQLTPMTYSFDLVPSGTNLVMAAQVAANSLNFTGGGSNQVSNALQVNVGPSNFLFPKGAYALWPTSTSLISSGLTNNLSMTGVFLHEAWANLETSPGVFDWSQLDARIAEAELNGMNVEISIAYGPSVAPPWVLQNSQNFISLYDEGNGGGCTQNNYVSGPVYWDSYYHQSILSMIDALAQRYSGRATVVGVGASIMNWDNDDMVFPYRSGQINCNNYSATINQAKQWLAAGWSVSLMSSTMSDLVNRWATDFPNQLSKVAIHHIYNVPTLDTTGYDIVSNVIATAQSTAWSSRFSVQGDFLTAASLTASAVASAPITQYQNDAYTLKLIASGSINPGQQMDTGAVFGANNGCLLNGGVSPCSNFSQVIENVSAVGLTYNPLYLEYFQKDALSTAEYSGFAWVLNAMGVAPRTGGFVTLPPP